MGVGLENVGRYGDNPSDAASSWASQYVAPEPISSKLRSVEVEPVSLEGNGYYKLCAEIRQIAGETTARSSLFFKGEAYSLDRSAERPASSTDGELEVASKVQVAAEQPSLSSVGSGSAKEPEGAPLQTGS